MKMSELTKLNIEELRNLTKTVVETGFVIDEKSKSITYQGHPKTFKYNVPKMVTIVENLDTSEGFKVVRSPKQYLDKKSGTVKTTNVTTISFTDINKAKKLVELVNGLIKAEYEDYKKNNK